MTTANRREFIQRVIERFKDQTYPNLELIVVEEIRASFSMIPHGGSHPDPNEHRFRSVVAEKLAHTVFASSQRSRCEDADAAFGDFVKLRCDFKEIQAGMSDAPGLPGLSLQIRCVERWSAGVRSAAD